MKKSLIKSLILLVPVLLIHTLPASAPGTSMPAVQLQPVGGTLQRIGNKTIADVVKASSVGSFGGLLIPSVFSFLSPSDYKIYYDYLNELFFVKLSMLMATTVAAPDATPTLQIQDPALINPAAVPARLVNAIAPFSINSATSKTDSIANFAAKNMYLSRYARSFNRANYDFDTVNADHELTPLDTFAGVIVINDLPNNDNPVSFSPSISDVGYDNNNNTIYYPDRVTLLPDYVQTLGYDADVFGLSASDSSLVVNPGQVKFIPVADCADAWYNQTNDQSPSTVRSYYYQSITEQEIGAHLTLDTTLTMLTIANQSYVTLAEGNVVSPYIALYIDGTVDNYIPSISLVQPYNNSVTVLNNTNCPGLSAFFADDAGVQWAPVLKISGGSTLDGTTIGVINIIGLVKLNPYYFPLYYSGGAVQQSQLNQSFTVPTSGPVSIPGVGTYNNSITTIPYFSERRIFDSLANFSTAVSNMGLMPTSGYRIPGLTSSLVYQSTGISTNQSAQVLFQNPLINLVNAGINIGITEFQSFIGALEALANSGSDLDLTHYLTQVSTAFNKNNCLAPFIIASNAQLITPATTQALQQALLGAIQAAMNVGIADFSNFIGALKALGNTGSSMTLSNYLLQITGALFKESTITPFVTTLGITQPVLTIDMSSLIFQVPLINLVNAAIALGVSDIKSLVAILYGLVLQSIGTTTNPSLNDYITQITGQNFNKNNKLSTFAHSITPATTQAFQQALLIAVQAAITMGIVGNDLVHFVKLLEALANTGSNMNLVDTPVEGIMQKGYLSQVSAAWDPVNVLGFNTANLFNFITPTLPPTASLLKNIYPEGLLIFENFGTGNGCSTFQNFGQVKMSGLLNFDYIFEDPTKTNYQTLFTQSLAALKKYYVLPAFLSSTKDANGLTALERLLNNPTAQQTATITNATLGTTFTDTFIPISSGNLYMPVLKVTTTYYPPLNN